MAVGVLLQALHIIVVFQRGERPVCSRPAALHIQLASKFKTLNFSIVQDADSLDRTSFIDLQELEGPELLDLSGCVSWDPASCWPVLKQQFSASGVHEVTVDIPAAVQAGFISCSTMQDRRPALRQSDALTLRSPAPEAEQQCLPACWEWDVTCSLEQADKDVCLPCTGGPILGCDHDRPQTTCMADEEPYLRQLLQQLLETISSRDWLERIRRGETSGCFLLALGFGLFLLGATVASRRAPQDRLGHTNTGRCLDDEAWEAALFQLSHNLVPQPECYGNVPTLYYKCMSVSSSKRQRGQQPVWGRDMAGRLLRQID